MFPTSEESDWYVGDGDHIGGDCNRFDLTDLALINEVDYLEDVLEEEEEEDEYDEEEVSDTSDSRNLPGVSRERYEEEEERPSNAVIVPTFLCPADLPSFHERLAETGVSLEAVRVDRGQITGTVALADSLIPGISRDFPGKDSTVHRVCVRFSADGWASEPREAATTAVADSTGVHYEFEIEAGGMEVGDDVEMVAVCVMDTDMERVDDNRGLRYRFICKNRPKFQPGKSLW